MTKMAGKCNDLIMRADIKDMGQKANNREKQVSIIRGPSFLEDFRAKEVENCIHF
jgi:hypothetical protein